MTVAPSEPVDGVVTKPSPYGFDATVDRVLSVVHDHALVLFDVIDHAAAASQVGLDMPATKVVIFGSPIAGTPIMVDEPLAALSLPLKVLVWSDISGATSVSYEAPGYLADRYHLSVQLRSRLDAIDAVTDAIVEPTDGMHEPV